MSADNWATCPRCYNRAIEERDKREAYGQKRVEEAYGKVSIEDFDKMRNLHKAVTGPIDAHDFRTFREDYEIGMEENGDFEVSYSGGCTVCGLKLEYRHSQSVDLKEAAVGHIRG